MKLLAFAASNSKNSINQELVIHAASVFKAEFAPSAEVEVLDLNDYEMPIYSIDRETADGVPALAQQFKDKIEGADGLLISFAEHNGTYSVAYKNIFDWTSRLPGKVFEGKKKVVMSASPGKNGGSNVLQVAVGSAPFFGAEVMGSFAVGPFAEKFQGGELVDADLKQTMRGALKALKEAAE